MRMTVAAIALLVAAHAFDYVTFLVMVARHGLEAELNPVVVALSEGFGLPGLTVAKIGSVVFLAAVALLIAPRHRKGAALLLLVGVSAGLVGGFSNVISI
jgi:hypothetical protein